MPEISEATYQRLRESGSITDQEHTELHEANDDAELDEGTTIATTESQPAPTNQATTENVQEVEAVRAGLLAQAAEAEARGDWHSAGTLRARAAHAPSSSLVPVATAPATVTDATPVTQQIAEAESAGEWQKAMALKTAQLLGSA